jgi:diguanylate cyclase (GGDEF)-like protein
MFPNISIKTKLPAGYVLALALIVALGLFALYQLSTLNRFMADMTGSWLPEIESLTEMKRAATTHRLLAERRTDIRSFRELAAITTEMQTAAATFRSQADEFRAKADDEEEQEALNQILAHWEDYTKSFDAVTVRLDSGELDSAQAALEKAFATFDTTLAEIRDLIEVVKEEGVETVEEAGQMHKDFLIATLTAIAIGLIGVVLAAYLVNRNISRPIRQVSEAMHRLSDGDASVVLPDGGGRRDEIGNLITAADGYRQSLIHSRELAAEASLERERLTAATENMPVGLSMYDEEKRLILCNRQFVDMYNLPPALTKPGTPLLELLDHRIASGGYPGDNPQKSLAEALKKVDGREPFIELIERKDGRVVSFTYQPMASGGWVSMHEDVTARRKVEARVAHMAKHDALTDLPNRVMFREKITAALAKLNPGESVAVLYLDLDHFKAVNDTLGHPVGDDLLRAVGNGLREAIREQDAVARLGGDEFAVIQVGQQQPLGATALAQRIIEAISRPHELQGHQVVCGTSVGISIAPNDGIDADILLRNSDMALYRAKQDGRGTYRFFEQGMDELMQKRRHMEIDLRKALVTKEFEVHYQPIFNLASNEIGGFEALIRWRHPARGLVSPGEFIPIAEETGLIVPIGHWVLLEACTEAKRWPADLKVAINLSPAQFKSPKLLASVVSALSESGLAPSRLELEITESVLLQESDATMNILHQLRDLGIRISMDDFGTGYSSLSYLRSFPFDKIKIDQSFIQDSEHDSSVAIIRAVTGLGNSLGMATTAEGVETLEQLARARHEGVTQIQGYLIGAPRPASHIPEVLKADRPGITKAA